MMTFSDHCFLSPNAFSLALGSMLLKIVFLAICHLCNFFLSRIICFFFPSYELGSFFLSENAVRLLALRVLHAGDATITDLCGLCFVPLVSCLTNLSSSMYMFYEL